MAGIADHEGRTIMAFVNEKLAPEEREAFAARGIKRPTSSNLARPLYKTIDKEKNIYLWHLGNLGRDDFDHHEFLFEWNNEKYLVILQYSNPEVGHIIWSTSVYEKLLNGKEPFIDDFKNALLVYAVNGRPDQQGTLDIKVEIEGGYGDDNR